MGRMRMCIALVAWFVIVPGPARAQTAAGSIAGTVRDTTGAVLPGVTVEASSPALIEKVRSVVTDDAGQYRIVDLRPGTYAVTFTLPGFGTVRREGIELTTGFTAPVNADLRVGSVEETISVTGEAPVVDVQNTQRQVVMTREVIDTVPTSRTIYGLGVLIPGVSAMGLGARAGTNAAQDVGGTGGFNSAVGVGLAIHGGRQGDQQLQVDGMPILTWSNVYQASHMLADGNFQEYAMDVSSNAAEIESGGVRINMIPRDGGNTFTGRFFASGSHPSLQSDNLDDALKQQGLRDVNHVKAQWQYNPSLGGPVIKDNLWFFATFTHVYNEQYIAGSYINTNPAAWEYVPDVTRQAVEKQYGYDFGIRGTWQATPRNRITGYYNPNSQCQCHNNIGGATKLDASVVRRASNQIRQATWTSPFTNRLLFEVGASSAPLTMNVTTQPESVAPQINDTGLNAVYRAGNPMRNEHRNFVLRGSASYITGTHAVKVGFRSLTGSFRTANHGNSTLGDTTFAALNGVPTSVTYLAYPNSFINYVRPNLGIYGQDQWTLRRVTMNLGVRYDYFRAGYPDQSVPPSQWVRNVRSVSEFVAVRWHDLSPRLGVAYDLFSNGKTALKASAGRYILADGTALAQNINPIVANNSDTRRWTDLNGDRVVQGDPFTREANGELGPSTNLSFGQPATSLEYDPDWAFGFGLRPYNWEFSASIQHELVPRVSVSAGYFRRAYGNFYAIDNQALTPADFDPYCVTTPTDARLPGGGGQQICGLYDLKAAKVGQQRRVGTSASNYGDQSEQWNGIDLTVQARLEHALLQGGVSTGKTTADNCEIVTNNPQVVTTAPNGAIWLTSGPSTPTQFCRVEGPFSAHTQVKLLGSYTLPWDMQLSGTFQNLPGTLTLGSATFTSAQIAPSLGRGLAAASTVSVPIIAPASRYGERLQQFDLRLAKTVTVQGARLQGMLDLYNMFNASPATLVSTTYGATTGSTPGAAFERPQAVMAARLIKVSMQLSF